MARAEKKRKKNAILVTAMSVWEPSHSNNELREVSRGHSTSKKNEGRAEQS